MRDDHCPGWTPDNEDHPLHESKGGFPLLVQFTDGNVVELILSADKLPLDKTFRVLKKVATVQDKSLWLQAFNEGYQMAKRESLEDY